MIIGEFNNISRPTLLSETSKYKNANSIKQIITKYLNESKINAKSLNII